MYIIKLLLIVKTLLFAVDISSKERIICKINNSSEVLNFYISEKKLYLSGLSISGTYSIIIKYKSGIIAMNMSNIGDETGTEIIYLDMKNKTFTVKSILSKKSKNNMVVVYGNC